VRIEKPIFIVGTGRSGSTTFLNMFVAHPDIAWLSVLCDKFPGRPSMNGFVMKAVDFPVIGRSLRKIFNPGESWLFWEYHCKGFSTPCRDLLSEDVTIKVKKRIEDVMSQMLTDKRRRLVIKVTGWPRIGFVKEIFSDAKFIHILRDGRAVVNSLINVDWWWGWRGPRNWRLDELTQSQNEEWERHGKSFICLAAIEWKILMDAMEMGRKLVHGDDFLEVKYEDLCAEPIEVFKKITGFCHLKWSREFEESVKKRPLRSTNYKWREDLTPHQQSVVEDVLHDYLKKYGYS